jgi:Domain of unknown function (DUF4873)
VRDEDGYEGPAEVLLDGDRTVAVRAVLSGAFEPVEGRYQWYGRVSAPDLTDLVGAGRLACVLRTPAGEAAGELAEPDTWGRYRVSGTSTPPFHVATTLAEVEAPE